MMLTSVRGKEHNNFFLPEFVPDVWSNFGTKNYIKIFLLSRNYEKLYSFFLPRDTRNAQRFPKEGFAFVNRWQDADIIVAERYEYIEEFLRRNPIQEKQVLLHTHEPTRYYQPQRMIRVHYVNVHAMGCFTKDVWTNNILYFPVDEKLRTQEHRIVPVPPLNTILDRLQLHRKIVIVATCKRKVTRQVGNLARMRTQLALLGHRSRMIDIYGKGWPRGMSLANDTQGRDGKLRILASYDFCLCFENTLAPYYVTEKIWEAIMGKCLPIYYGNPWIYETFPKDSFIDYSNFRSPYQLFQYVMTMTPDEWRRRMNLCIDVFNKQRDQAVNKFDTLYENLFDRLRSITSTTKRPRQVKKKIA